MDGRLEHIYQPRDCEAYYVLYCLYPLVVKRLLVGLPPLNLTKGGLKDGLGWRCN